VVMVLGCFLVICRVSRDGNNLAIEELAGLHRRSPWLAATLLVGLFGLAGLPPFVGFMGKLSMVTATLEKGHLFLVIVTMVNAAIAIYYYLRVAREVIFNEPAAGGEPLPVSFGTKVLCASLVVAIVVLGLAPATMLDALQQAVAAVHAPLG
jgi:NADH-quinone oxidoreductase subunit N